jgi:hypothetical protein
MTFYPDNRQDDYSRRFRISIDISDVVCSAPIAEKSNDVTHDGPLLGQLIDRKVNTLLTR